MGRKRVIEIQCSRCERVEHLEGVADETSERGPAFTVKLYYDGQPARSVVFEDLCGPCYRTVLSLVDQAGKRIEGVSPDREVKAEAKKKEPAPKAPTPPAHPPTGNHASAAAPAKRA